ncbi:MAG: DUF6788 family protein [Leptospirales bacterium]
MSDAHPKTLQAFEARRDQIKQDILALRDLRPGSLTQFYRKCGEPSCACAREGGIRHGPDFQVTWKSDRQETLTQSISESFLEITRKQIDEYHRFRALSKELIAVNEQICRLKIDQGREQSSESVKKLETALVREVSSELDHLLGTEAGKTIDLEALEKALRSRCL